MCSRFLRKYHERQENAFMTMSLTEYLTVLKSKQRKPLRIIPDLCIPGQLCAIGMKYLYLKGQQIAQAV